MSRLLNWGVAALGTACMLLSGFTDISAEETASLHVGVISTKKIFEESKLAQEAQKMYQKLKSQMDTALEAKLAAFQEIERQEKDEDYMESLSKEAAGELRLKKKGVEEEANRIQGQYFQLMQQARGKVMQKLLDQVGVISKKIAEQGLDGNKLDLILSDESCTYFAAKLDITEKVVAEINALYESEQAKGGSIGPSAPNLP